MGVSSGSTTNIGQSTGVYCHRLAAGSPERVIEAVAWVAEAVGRVDGAEAAFIKWSVVRDEGDVGELVGIEGRQDAV